MAEFIQIRDQTQSQRQLHVLFLLLLNRLQIDLDQSFLMYNIYVVYVSSCIKYSFWSTLSWYLKSIGKKLLFE